MSVLSELKDESQKLAVFRICLKEEDLNHNELEALAQWMTPITLKPLLDEVIEIRKYLRNTDAKESDKFLLRNKISKEILALDNQNIEPASLPEVDESKYSQKLLITLSAYLATVALIAKKSFIEVLHNKNPAIKRAIGYAIYELGAQMASGDYDSTKILKESLEGFTRGSSELIIDKFIPENLQKAATVMTQGAIRATFFAISNNVTKATSLATLVVGAFVAPAISNYVVNKAALSKVAIDTINKSIIKSTIDAFHKGSMTMGIHTFIVTAAREAAYYTTGGTDALQRREPIGILESSTLSNNIKDISKIFQPKLDKAKESDKKLTTSNANNQIEHQALKQSPIKNIHGWSIDINPYTLNTIADYQSQVSIKLPNYTSLLNENNESLSQNQVVSLPNITSNIALGSALVAMGVGVYKNLVNLKTNSKIKDLDKKLTTLKSQFDSLFKKREAEYEMNKNLELQKERNQLESLSKKTEETIKRLEEFNSPNNIKSKSELKQEALAIWNSYLELEKNRKITTNARIDKIRGNKKGVQL